MSREAVARAICCGDEVCQAERGERHDYETGKALPCRAVEIFGEDADAALAALPVTDEVVEAAARAIDPNAWFVVDVPSEARAADKARRQQSLTKARAALEAALKVWRE